ncbi:MAG: carboxylesterase family protein [bacterium]
MNSLDISRRFNWALHWLTGSLLVLFSLTLLSISAAQAGQETEPLVSTASGTLQGFMSGDVEVFLGVPFAQPPVGELRWREPQPLKSWEGIRTALEYGPACPQPANLLFADAGESSEDCLYLNIWTAGHSQRRQPVIVYLHGGAFIYGSGSQQAYDGAALAARGIVVVTLNYRLGALGFLAHPELSAQSPTHTSGNYGLLDQLAALRWVRDNISAFGGDPGNVTLMGESAGAVSVCTLMSSPLSSGLFQQAVVMSGGAPGRLRNLSSQRNGLASMESLGEDWAAQRMQRLGLHDFSELRQVPWQSLQGAGIAGIGPRDIDIVDMMSMDGTICIDGYLLQDSPAEIFRSGKQLPVPVMCGSLRNEGAMFTLGMRFRNMQQYEGVLERIFGPRLDIATELYPAADTNMALAQLSTFISDGFGAGVRNVARSTDSAGNAAWLYRFDYVNPLARLTGIGTFHGSEVPYFFGSFPVPAAYGRGSELLSSRLGDYLESFARTGNPNGSDNLEWPAYDQSQEALLQINLPMSRGAVERTRQFDLISESGLW